MDSKTLVTFWFKASPEIRTVELYGSWDNFANGYFLQHDLHKGCGNWTGVPHFPRIICDGDGPNWSRPRSGALKQGGRYWYYYKLDDEAEVCDPSKPTTSACSLLPGQLLNVMDVPMEFVEPPSRMSSASASVAPLSPPQMTYDPADRYKKVKRQHPTTLPRDCCSSDALLEKATGYSTDKDDPILMSPTKVQRLDSSGKPLLKRGRGGYRPAPAYQQRGFDLVRSAPNDLEAPIPSLSRNNHQASEFSALRPFAPMAGCQSYHFDRPSTSHGLSGDALDFKAYQPGLQSFVPASRFRCGDEDRSPTRHGNAKNAAIGLGISFSGFDFESQSAVTSADEDEILNTPSRPSRRARSPPTSVEHYNQPPDTRDWPVQHPNPLGANPNPNLDPSPTSRYPMHSYFSPSTASSPDVCAVEQSEDFPGHAQGTTDKYQAGLYDMCSPTFTAATLDTVEGGESTTPPSDPCDLDVFNTPCARSKHQQSSSQQSFAQYASQAMTPAFGYEDYGEWANMGTGSPCYDVDDDVAAEIKSALWRRHMANASTATLLPASRQMGMIAMQQREGGPYQALCGEVVPFADAGAVGGAPSGVSYVHAQNVRNTYPEARPTSLRNNSFGTGDDFASSVFGALGFDA
ncbi:hypothetical protein BDV97DRAFT_70818 [Delphinella strobiligena]|nr:hypothetical protein BDV97DRAFT_70818 [Delphinella strobiligena]